MADLKYLFETLGFQAVRTNIQSGNVIFETDQSKAVAATDISTAFSTAFGFESAVILRSANEMSKIINHLPFNNEEIAAAQVANSAVEHLYIFMLEQTLPTAEIAKLCEAYCGSDTLHAGEHELYLLCWQSIRDSKLAISLGKLPVAFTSRNWKTINKVYALMENN